MTVDELRTLLSGFPEVTEEQPFGPDVLVYKVAGKVFAIMPDDPDGRAASVTLKCDPDWALELRAQYPAVQPGYHVDKRHWNTVTFDDSVPGDEVVEMIEHSYRRVVDGLRRVDRDRLRALFEP